jgi:hypothetical protein
MAGQAKRGWGKSKWAALIAANGWKSLKHTGLAAKQTGRATERKTDVTNLEDEDGDGGRHEYK